MASANLLKALQLTAELTQTEISLEATRVMVADLEAYPEAQVFGALLRCRRELRTRLTIADIVSRLDDGRPGPDEAWARIPRGEEDTVVWSDEMAAAFGIASPLLAAGDQIAARMAFREAYSREVTQARAEQKPAIWRVSLGSDREGREGPIREAVARGWISPEMATKFLPPPAQEVDPKGMARIAVAAGQMRRICQDELPENQPDGEEFRPRQQKVCHARLCR
ncbi:MAG: hypothetical protein ACYDHY_12805 [Acidiferrobacterales bacterium]